MTDQTSDGLPPVDGRGPDGRGGDPAPATPPARVRKHRVRRAFAAVLVALSCLLILVSSLVVWTHYTVLNSDGFVQTVAPAVKSQAVTAALGEELTNQVFTALDVTQRVKNILPTRAEPLAVPLVSSVKGFVQEKITNVLRRPRVSSLLSAALHYTHDQVIAALRGQGTALRLVDGAVVLNLLPVLNQGLQAVQSQASGLLGRNLTLPTVTSGELPATAQARLSQALGVPIPKDFGAITLFRANQIKIAQNAVSLLDLLLWLLPLVTALCIAAAIWVSPRRRRSILQLSVATFLLFVLFRRVGFRFVDELVASAKTQNQTAASDILRQLTGTLFDVTVWILCIAATVAVIALVSGPYPWARSLRHGVARAAKALGRGVASIWAVLIGREHRGPVLDWMGRNRTWVQVGTVVVASVLLFTLPWVGVIVVAAAVVVIELVLWRLGSAADAAAAEPADGPPAGLLPPSDQLTPTG